MWRGRGRCRIEFPAKLATCSPDHRTRALETCFENVKLSRGGRAIRLGRLAIVALIVPLVMQSCCLALECTRCERRGSDEVVYRGYLDR